MNVKKIEYDINNGVMSSAYGDFDLNLNIMGDDWEKDSFKENGFIDEVFTFSKCYIKPLSEAEAISRAKDILELAIKKGEEITEEEYWIRKEEYIHALMTGVTQDIYFQNIVN